MGLPGWTAPLPPHPARRSIRFTFGVMVAAPVVCLVLLWGLAVSAILANLFGQHGFSSRFHRGLLDVILVVGATLVVVLISALLMGTFARRLSREITALEATARYLSDDQITDLVQRLRRGDRPALPRGGPLKPRMRITEISRAAQAIASLQHTAVTAAVGEARLRGGIGDVFVSLARRNQSLLQRQLHLIDELERKAVSPAALADLFPLDHLTTRMRRQAESLIILSGAAPGRSWSEPVPVIDVTRGAVAEIEDYRRIAVGLVTDGAVTGSAAADMIHLMAELIENAALFSPSATRVEVRGERVVNGYAIDIEDRGLGIKPAQLAAINQQLADPPDFDLANADQLGLFVVGKLAARHGVRVTLRPSPYGGTTATVLMPTSIVVPVSGASLPPDSSAAAPAPGSSAAPGGTYRGLPRRVRQASLSPELRKSLSAGRPAPAGPAPGAPQTPPAGARTPEQARDLVASLQSGWRRGRSADPQEVEPAASTRPLPRQDPEAPGSKEEL